MPQSSFPLFLTVLIVLHIAVQNYCRAEFMPILTHCSGLSFTPSRPYETNLHHLIAGLVASTPNNPSLFSLINSTTSPKIAGLAQCRPDLSPAVCAACLNQSAGEASRPFPGCGQLPSGSIRLNNCLLRYTDKVFDNGFERQKVLKDEGPNASASFNRRAQDLMRNLTAAAAENPLRFAVGVSNGSGDAEDIFGMGWCSIDMASSDCWKCLDSALGRIAGMQRGLTENISCQMRLETHLFFAGSMIATSPAPSPAAAGGKRSCDAKRFILMGSFAAAVLLLIA